MTYSAAETTFLAGAGARDLVLAYPTVQPSDAALIARANRDATAAIVVDDETQLAPLASAAKTAGTTIPVWVDVDMSWRPLGSALHLGVRRSPLREPEPVVALARRVAEHASLRFAGVLGYEAQLAGLPDRAAFRAWQNPIKRAVKRGSKPAIAERRARVVEALRAAGLAPEHVNGGGTGSVAWSSSDHALTEITIGSGFLCGHLFDGYWASTSSRHSHSGSRSCAGPRAASSRASAAAGSRRVGRRRSVAAPELAAWLSAARLAKAPARSRRRSRCPRAPRARRSDLLSPREVRRARRARARVPARARRSHRRARADVSRPRPLLSLGTRRIARRIRRHRRHACRQPAREEALVLVLRDHRSGTRPRGRPRCRPRDAA